MSDWHVAFVLLATAMLVMLAPQAIAELFLWVAART